MTYLNSIYKERIKSKIKNFKVIEFQNSQNKIISVARLIEVDKIFYSNERKTDFMSGKKFGVTVLKLSEK